MNNAVLVLGIIETLICVIAFFFKKKQHFLICLEIYNVILLVQYLIQGFHTECIFAGIDILKVAIFFVFDYKDKKPQLWIVVLFEIAMISIGVLTFENWFSIFVILSSMISTFAAWQPNMFILRLSYILCSVLLISNYVFTGLYTTIIAEAITLVSSVVSIIKYHIVDPKREKIEIAKLQTEDLDTKT